MIASQVNPTIRPLTEEGEEHVFLMGRPPLEEYLGFMMTEPGGAETANIGQLATEWREANDHIKTLQASEKTLADNPSIEPIPTQLASAVADLMVNPVVQRSYAIVPFDIGMVELDRLVVFQKHIDLGYVRQIQDRLRPNLSDEAIFKLCLSSDHPIVPYKVRRIAQNQFSFVSVSNDLRLMGIFNLKPDQISGLPPVGVPVSIIAAVVGYGVNFLSAMSVENRLVLFNASHRAYALRELGIKHAPCLIQRVTRREELNAVAAGTDLLQNTDSYLKEPRPPMLKDYFDPKLRKVVRLPSKARQVRIGVGTEISDIPWEQS